MIKKAKWKVLILSALLVTTFMIVGCGKGSPVVKIITAVQGESNKQYSIIYDNQKIDKAGEFKPDNGTVLELDGSFLNDSSESCYAYVMDLNNGDISDSKVTSPLDKAEQRIVDDVKNLIKHPIYKLQIFRMVRGGNTVYFPYVILNVNWHTPSTLYKFDNDSGKLEKLYSWDDEEAVQLVGLKLV